MTEQVVKNIWLLLLYASDLYKKITHRRFKEMESNPDRIPYLVAEILTEAVQRRLRRSLSLRYRRRDADLRRMRGSIDMLRTERRQLLQLGKVACSFDELTADTPENRFVKAALNKLDGDMRRNKFGKNGGDLSHRCRVGAASLERAGVGNGVYSELYRRVGFRLGRLDEADKETLAAAKLVRDWLPYDSSNMVEEKVMQKLFEKAVLGFYRFKEYTGDLKGWKVHGGQKEQTWQVSSAAPRSAESLVPKMRLDILLESKSADRKVIIDTKYKDMLTKPDDESRSPKFRTDDIYQMYAYLRSQEGNDGRRSSKPAGILLYGKAAEERDMTVNIQGYDLHFVSVNLNADSKHIRNRLLGVVSRV